MFVDVPPVFLLCYWPRDARVNGTGGVELAVFPRTRNGIPPTPVSDWDVDVHDFSSAGYRRLIDVVYRAAHSG